MVSMLLANFIGAILVFAFVRYGVPIPESQEIIADRVRNVAIFGGYLAFAAVVSLTAAAMMLRSVVRWQLRGGPPTRSEQMSALHAPLRQAIVQNDVTIDGSPSMLAHFLNGRRDPRRAGFIVKKPDDDQDYAKVDLVWGSMFAFIAGLEAIGKGVLLSRKTVPRRIY